MPYYAVDDQLHMHANARRDGPAVTDPHACAVTAISLLNHRQHTWQTIELAVMALRGASLDALLAADRQMTGA